MHGISPKLYKVHFSDHQNSTPKRLKIVKKRLIIIFFFAFQVLIPLMLKKIRDLRALANERNPSLIIELDGGVTPETIPLMIEAGADALVCGNGTIFRPHEDSIVNKVNYIKGIINEI